VRLANFKFRVVFPQRRRETDSRSLHRWSVYRATETRTQPISIIFAVDALIVSPTASLNTFWVEWFLLPVFQPAEFLLAPEAFDCKGSGRSRRESFSCFSSHSSTQKEEIRISFLTIRLCLVSSPARNFRLPYQTMILQFSREGDEVLSEVSRKKGRHTRYSRTI